MQVVKNSVDLLQQRRWDLKLVLRSMVPVHKYEMIVKYIMHCVVFMFALEIYLFFLPNQSYAYKSINLVIVIV